MAGKGKEIESRISFVNYIGLAILLVCYIGALWNVYKIKEDEIVYKKKIIRLCHWQLELGIRDGLQEMADRYEKLHPDVKFLQLPVTERAYAQWVTTQLIGRTAPDIVELGFFDVRQYLGRYFQPITDDLRLPNPYNKDNPQFKNTPWMDTFTDGLQNSYIPELLDYYAVGFSQFSVRIFYNKELYRKILGKDAPPETLRELFVDCDRIAEYVKSRNAEIDAYNRAQARKKQVWDIFSSPLQKSRLTIVPIASSRYQVGLFRSRYAGILSSDRCMDVDYAFDGSATSAEILCGLLRGDLTLEDDKYRVSLELTRKLSSYFTPGFMSVDRMDAGFSFVQGNAAMITSGSWDASSYIKKISDQPFGDIILSVGDVEVSNAKEAVDALMSAVKRNDKAVHLLVDREGAKRKITVRPVPGATTWESYGIRLEDVVSRDGGKVPVVTELDSASPASASGMTFKKSFDVGIVDFPMPSRNDPDYGKYVVGKVVESSDTGFNFGITKFTDHRSDCIDFMQYCTTPENNQKFNEMAQWIPAVKTAKPIKFLEAFSPNFEGYWGWLNFKIGSKTLMLENQVFWPYISGENDYGKYIGALSSGFPYAAAVDYIEIIQLARETLPDKQVFRSVYLAQMLYPENFIDGNADSGPNREKLIEGKRREAERKLAASWDNLIAFGLEEVRIKAMMEPCFKNKDGNKFSKAFFTEYERLTGTAKGEK